MVHFEPQEILTTTAQIARYGGGTRHKPDDRMTTVIQEALDLAARLRPNFTNTWMKKAMSVLRTISPRFPKISVLN